MFCFSCSFLIQKSPIDFPKPLQRCCRKEKKKTADFLLQGSWQLACCDPGYFFFARLAISSCSQQRCVSLLLLLSRRTPLPDRVILDNAGCNSEAGGGGTTKTESGSRDRRQRGGLGSLWSPCMWGSRLMQPQESGCMLAGKLQHRETLERFCIMQCAAQQANRHAACARAADAPACGAAAHLSHPLTLSSPTLLIPDQQPHIPPHGPRASQLSLQQVSDPTALISALFIFIICYTCLCRQARHGTNGSVFSRLTQDKLAPPNKYLNFASASFAYISEFPFPPRTPHSCPPDEFNNPSHYSFPPKVTISHPKADRFHHKASASIFESKA